MYVYFIKYLKNEKLKGPHILQKLISHIINKIKTNFIAIMLQIM